ncbi:hypothetical protein HAX54_038772, partial [Datura stramonium]|nr:hypothetical protein [Datura stramonium]
MKCYQVCEEEANYVSNQAGGSGQTTKDSIKDLGIKVKGIKVETRTKITKVARIGEILIIMASGGETTIKLAQIQRIIIME